MKAALGIFLLTTMAVQGAQAEPDCALGQRYLALAKARVAASESDEAVAFLRHAVEVCPAYDAYEQLGELQAQSPERADQTEAVKAFVAAHQLAPSAQMQARSLFQYASLLSRNGDPQNAYPMIRSARHLDPGNGEIAVLAERLEKQIDHPTHEEIVRGLQDSLYEPLRVAPAPEPESRPTAAGGSAAMKQLTGPSVNIPINFETATTLVDKRTWPNVTLLAHALADPSLSGRNFVFVGHADLRGTDDYNLSLSKQRAESMYRDMMLIEPSLKGRVEIVGRGAREPLDPGTDPEALRANRRLQVILK
jgi:outer membrane protein OmpA-like peptidoglycan-associated protein